MSMLGQRLTRAITSAIAVSFILTATTLGSSLDVDANLATNGDQDAVSVGTTLAGGQSLSQIIEVYVAGSGGFTFPVTYVVTAFTGVVAGGESGTITASGRGSGDESTVSFTTPCTVGAFAGTITYQGTAATGSLSPDSATATITGTVTTPCPVSNTAPSVPGAPELASVDSTPNQGAFGLTWAASTDDGKPAGSTVNYTLLGKDANDAAYAVIASNITTNAYAFASGQPAEGTWTFVVTATDGALTSAASAASPAIVVDRTGPSAPTATLNPAAPYYTTWYRDSVVVSYSGSTDGDLPDGSAGSGVASYTPSQTFNTSDAAHGYSGTAADAAGNIGPAASGNVAVDATNPEYSCDPAPTAWSASDITINCTASDAHSGLKPPGTTFSLSTSVVANTETANASTGSTSVTDNVDHTVGVPAITGLKVDKKAPVVSLTCPTAPVILSASATASWSATDGGSGVAGADSGTIALNTSTIGIKTATAAAGLVADNVGNSSVQQSCTYEVRYNFSGFFSPVDNNGVLNLLKAGQAVPLKFRLLDADNNPVLTGVTASVTVTSLSCSAGTSQDLLEEVASGSSGLQNLGDGYYQFNWKTPTSYANSCKTMRLNLAEGGPTVLPDGGPNPDAIFHTALFQFKK